MQGQIPSSANIQPQAVAQPQQVAYPYASQPSLAPQVPPVSTANPNYAGVNIQIFNPMVGTPNGNIYQGQTASAYGPGVQGGCYPANYYTTGQYPQGTFVPQNPYGQVGTLNQGTQSGYYDQNGAYYPQMPNPAAQGSENAQDEKTAQTGQESQNVTGEQKTEASATEGLNNAENKDAKTPENAQDANAAGKNSDAGEKKPQSADDKNGTKTEKRKVVELTDDYIKTLENYLNSQDTEVRLMGAKEVVNRLTEDESRKDDPALTALVNKMLQDPSASIRAIALSLIESRTILGDDYTVNVLKKMQTSKEGYGQDSVQATSALLKMAGKTVEKEVEVKEPVKNESKK